MKAEDVMVTEVVSVTADTPVEEIARLMMKHAVSGLPVTDEQGGVVGIVSEGDLIRRPEIGTDEGSRRAGWLSLFTDAEAQSRAFVRSHGRRADDVMTRDVVSVDEDTPLIEVARLLEKHHIKRVPVTRSGQLVGIVSRANLVQALAAVERYAPELPADDRDLRVRVLEALHAAGVRTSFLNIVVHGGEVEVWGAAESDTQRDAVRVAVENIVPPERVTLHIGLLPTRLRAMMWNS
ncbi:CBS domain-containing protein [Arhodomonas sp. AD133]|uniref:CBS domain-containing protein n=1 Tax=Arhodomonas sp. AD133 TaxID=3415009 RepID=UPI003EBE05B4